MPRHSWLLIAFALIPAASAAEPTPLADVNPNVFAPDDPRTKTLPKMMWADATRRMQEANLRESKAFAEVTTKEQWTQYRDVRIQKLKESLGSFPEVPKDMLIKVTRKLEGDGFVIHNILYETRPGLWVSANLYLPAKPPEKMPGILISHSHHTPKTQGELQDMGMTWARSGVAVLIPDHLGHGERRQHDFKTNADYPGLTTASRQDYYFRYNSNLQLSAAGESLMGWMVWDLMRGVDVLLKQPTIDKDRIILLGAVAGGGDVAGVTAALDPRIACVTPFNFGGWQPESTVSENPDRDTPWFGDGYWESTRGLKNGARDGFAHFVIVGSVAPRKVIYAHEFAWEAEKDPAWPRLQKIFGFYDAKSSIVSIHGKGKVSGQAGPDNTHCTHIGAVHRKGIYPALKEWFGMPIPEEYSKRLPAEDLLCWTEEAKKELGPKKFHEIVGLLGERRAAEAREALPGPLGERTKALRKLWADRLGEIDPPANPKVTTGKTEEVPGGTLARFTLEIEPDIVVPLLLITPKDAKGKVPVVVMISSEGKQAFLRLRSDVIADCLKAGVAVCLPDVRGTGETRPRNDSPARTDTRTSISQTNLILGQPVLGSQLRDLRTVIRWLGGRGDIDGKKLALWGDTFTPVNADLIRSTKVAVPLDSPDLPTIGEPSGPLLAVLARLSEDGVVAVYLRGRLRSYADMYERPYLYLPHEVIIPGGITAGDLGAITEYFPGALRADGKIDGLNRRLGDMPSISGGTTWLIEQLRGK